MRLKRHIAEHRVRRMKLRAKAQTPAPVIPQPRVLTTNTQLTAPTMLPEDPRRQSRRVPVAAEFTVKKLGGFGFQLRAFDLSIGGCRIELIEMVDSGERVIVRLPALEPLGAEVTWVDGANAGLHFQRPLHPAVFDQLMRRFTSCAA
jgi:hypothetical protein